MFATQLNDVAVRREWHDGPFLRPVRQLRGDGYAGRHRHCRLRVVSTSATLRTRHSRRRRALGVRCSHSSVDSSAAGTA